MSASDEITQHISSILDGLPLNEMTITEKRIAGILQNHDYGEFVETEDGKEWRHAVPEEVGEQE